ncbi:PAS domain-containing sensor histidine kinase [Candidatus Azambacteria bacterium]|nr:PAS domain-containing sensor histidine kinase [Candidatus Azambacteria bacterium]
MRKTLAEGKSFSTDELMNKRKNGSEYQEYTAISPVKDNENVIFYIGISQDITRHKEIDKAKTEFVSLASHQLRTPLAIIKWYSELLLSGDAGKMTVKQKDYINEMHRGGVRMIGLVNALLNVSRIELGKLGITPEPANLSAMANSALLDFVPQIKDKKLKIKKLFEKGLSKVPVDLKLMRAIFQNLISNAVKYTPEKGEIKIGIKKENSEIVISVADTGYGIPKNQKDKIFSKLFRADNIMKKDVDGTGLGLYLVKAIVDEARGRIWFESEENKGTTFYISFPLSGMHAVSGSKDFSEEKNVV